MRRLRPSSAPRHLDTAAERLALCEALVARGVTDESDVTWTELGWDVPGTATTVALSGWRRLRRKVRAARNPLVRDGMRSP